MQHSTSHRTIRAGIFDMDGVLLDSEPLHHQAVNELLAEEGRDGLSLEEYVPYMGTTDEYTWNDLIRRRGLQKGLSHYQTRYDSAVLGRYRRSSRIAPGVQLLLGELRQRGIRLAVASSSRREWVETCLTALEVRTSFEVVVSGDMVKRSKPDPEIYLLAAQKLDTPPGSCFAVEDSPKGVAAAVAAGMLTVAVDTPYTRGQPTETAQVHLRSLADFDCSLLDAGAAQIH